jgi:uncharacterized RDD family membrane protein YckC
VGELNSADRRHEVDTPEHVALSFALAGPGSRFLAFLLDALLLAGILTAMILGAVLLVMAGLPLRRPVPRESARAGASPEYAMPTAYVRAL